MSRRCDKVGNFPRRPSSICGETSQSVAWDMDEFWPTAAEWLAWVRRRDGKKTRWNGKRWSYPIRPMIRVTKMNKSK
ncbi:hypothetical protein LX82_03732 [Celeribacter halophilus]|uniref:Uncharacterized protein n=1 Tax=Celeribacter halophilus TaxID=576117 RepID=A0A1I3X722_9RHOB|nr:hypothetical protein LX82_03732 [Celeribacter halophilus]SFK14656.1 hypothetical protein SAMN04488138_1403 [Celeribacter halophilus]